MLQVTAWSPTTDGDSMRTLAYALVLLLALSGCRSSPGGAAPEPAPATATSIRTAAAPALPPDSAMRLVHDLGRSFGESREGIRKSLPRNCEESVRATPNQHGAGTDSIFVLRCPGARFIIRQAGPERREFLEYARLERSPPALPAGLQFGQSTAADLRRRFGAPLGRSVRADTLRLRYRVPLDGADEFVLFHLVQDVLRVVEWGFYVD